MTLITNKTYQIQAPHFTAGLLVSLTKPFPVIKAAPIIKYMKGWRFTRVLIYCNEKQWKVIETNND